MKTHTKVVVCLSIWHFVVVVFMLSFVFFSTKNIWDFRVVCVLIFFWFVFFVYLEPLKGEVFDWVCGWIYSTMFLLSKFHAAANYSQWPSNEVTMKQVIDSIDMTLLRETTLIFITIAAVLFCLFTLFLYCDERVFRESRLATFWNWWLYIIVAMRVPYKQWHHQTLTQSDFMTEIILYDSFPYSYLF